MILATTTTRAHTGRRYGARAFTVPGATGAWLNAMSTGTLSALIIRARQNAGHQARHEWEAPLVDGSSGSIGQGWRVSVGKG